MKRDLLARVIASILEIAVFKRLTLRVLGAASGGWIGWLVAEVYKKFQDKIVIPLIKMAVDNGLTWYDEDRAMNCGIRFYDALADNDLDGMKDAIKDMED